MGLVSSSGILSLKSLAIAQPTFLPWAGWFDLADQVDMLIVLDDVAFSKQSWQQRNRIQTSQGLSYITVPVRTSGRLGQRIIDTELSTPNFADKLIRTIATNYGRAAYFNRYFPGFCDVLRGSAVSGKLAELNEALIAWLADQLGITTPRVRSSELGIDGKRGEYVAKLCEHVGASHYVSPAGAEAYLIEDRDEFDRRGISVALQVYEHPVYRQCFQPFQSYASVLDLLFNEGESSGAVMRSGRRAARALGSTLPGEHPPLLKPGRLTADASDVSINADAGTHEGHSSVAELQKQRRARGD